MKEKAIDIILYPKNSQKNIGKKFNNFLKIQVFNNTDIK